MLKTKAGEVLGSQVGLTELPQAQRAIDHAPQRFLRRRAVEAMTGLPRSTIYELMDRGEFPRPVRLSPRLVGWIELEVADWQAARIAERDSPRR